MTEAVFLRLLNIPNNSKNDVLIEQVEAVNKGMTAPDTFSQNPQDFTKIPGSPFAYWVPDAIKSLYIELPAFEPAWGVVRVGAQTSGDEQFVRAFWEIPTTKIAVSREDTFAGKDWVTFAKGGAFSRYYTKFPLVVYWKNDGLAIKEYNTNSATNAGHWSRNIRSVEHYFRPGLTWGMRSHALGICAMPAGCIFSTNAYGAFVDKTDPLLALAIMASQVADYLLRMIVERAGYSKYIPGVVQRLPLPTLEMIPNHIVTTLIALATEQFNTIRWRDTEDETAHVFCLPRLVSGWYNSLLTTSARLNKSEQERQHLINTTQAQIDDIVFTLYGLQHIERAIVLSDTENMLISTPSKDASNTEAEDDTDEDEMISEDPASRIQSLLMWCVGVGFGRWDIRKALDPVLLPPLGDPFDTLPRCAPGALVGADGWPATSEEVGADYPLPIAWNGILVDDPANRSYDIVERVRGVLGLLWQEQAGTLERDMLAVLGIGSLREYFRNPRRFFEFHIRRYSKSRRKAPIYWLLQSSKRNYSVWLYIHRLKQDTLYMAARDFADSKVVLEETRLNDLYQGLESLSVTERKRREKEIDLQDKLVAEVRDFRDKLDKIAQLNLPPDLNDGVVLSIAPLHPLVPWKEAEKYWNELGKGKYEWSTMSKQMRAKGLIKG